MLFEDMTHEEKIAHVEKCCDEALKHLQLEHGPVYLADILDVWDYWLPWLISEVKK